jgi:hypothetical protein
MPVGSRPGAARPGVARTRYLRPERGPNANDGCKARERHSADVCRSETRADRTVISAHTSCAFVAVTNGRCAVTNRCERGRIAGRAGTTIFAMTLVMGIPRAVYFTVIS